MTRVPASFGAAGIALVAAMHGALGCASDSPAPATNRLADGGTPGDPCSIDSDCKNPDSCTRARCAVNGFCVYFPRDRDDDGHGDALCGGDDCNDQNPRANPHQSEDCTDGADNDCNGVADCNDPACTAGACGCSAGAAEEVCDDGADNDCDGFVDCFDGDCMGTSACGCDESEICGNGIDDDCDGLVDCDSPDCAQKQECTCGTLDEICFGHLDEDCDGLIDCADPDCIATGACGCTLPARPEQCGRFGDEDCDGLLDCADPDCSGDAACADCTAEDCANGKDDDCDGTIDCADSSCRFELRCKAADELCQNGIDDDHDGAIDCWDSECASNPACIAKHSTCVSPFAVRASGAYVGDTTGFVGSAESTHCGGTDAGEAVFRLTVTAPVVVSLDTVGSSFDDILYVRRGSCSLGRELACDDDSADSARAAKLALGVLQPGDYYIFVDGFRPAQQGAYVLNVDVRAPPAEVCDNDEDDDGDRYVDCADSDCAGAERCKACGEPKPEFGVALCTNGKDDDCDGKVDCADDDCAANPDYSAECCDGVDQNDNGITDESACRCASDGDCGDGEICYLHSTGTCSRGCGDFMRDVCSVFAPGSICNDTTRQCEF